MVFVFQEAFHPAIDAMVEALESPAATASR
jgi:hypothetical protein